ncbi:hypothetical protein CRE_31279 [Caenorhabditis remanei]|uniref:Uncharacterized protein n=1 Tax=Caenorhabditis remanei TaxID=31234 RepID=E3MLM1_CAERE|nr:hypothetical protein CRE_31279 [Caenorhabditis remanei]
MDSSNRSRSTSRNSSEFELIADVDHVDKAVQNGVEEDRSLEEPKETSADTSVKEAFPEPAQSSVPPALTKDEAMAKITVKEWDQVTEKMSYLEKEVDRLKAMMEILKVNASNESRDNKYASSSLRFNPQLDVPRQELEFPVRGSSPGRMSPVSQFMERTGRYAHCSPPQQSSRYRSTSPQNRGFQLSHQSRRDYESRSSRNGQHARSPSGSTNSWESSSPSQGNRNAQWSSGSPIPPRFRSPSIRNGYDARPSNRGGFRSTTPIRYLVGKMYRDPDAQVPCVFCGGEHFHDRCPVVVDPMERRAHLCYNGRCIACLRKNCPLFHPQLRCRYCDGRVEDVIHHSSVCTRPEVRESYRWQ